MMKVGGIILCGGKSTRMGLPKATLPFGPELMIERVIRLLGEVVDPIVVVAAPNQQLPDLPEHVIVQRDEHEDRGPLEGLYAGLCAIEPHAEAAYATSCDVPLLVPGFVQRLINVMEENDIVVPVEENFHHPLAAVYRCCVLPKIRSLLDADRMRPVFLFDLVETSRVPIDDLRAVDSQLLTLANLNRPQDYLDALSNAGFVPPADVVAVLENQSGSRGQKK